MTKGKREGRTVASMLGNLGRLEKRSVGWWIDAVAAAEASWMNAIVSDYVTTYAESSDLVWQRLS